MTFSWLPHLQGGPVSAPGTQVRSWKLGLPTGEQLQPWQGLPAGVGPRKGTITVCVKLRESHATGSISCAQVQIQLSQLWGRLQTSGRLSALVHKMGILNKEGAIESALYRALYIERAQHVLSVVIVQGGLSLCCRTQAVPPECACTFLTFWPIFIKIIDRQILRSLTLPEASSGFGAALSI